jgi:hypothetical protein
LLVVSRKPEKAFLKKRGCLLSSYAQEMSQDVLNWLLTKNRPCILLFFTSISFAATDNTKMLSAVSFAVFFEWSEFNLIPAKHAKPVKSSLTLLTG